MTESKSEEIARYVGKIVRKYDHLSVADFKRLNKLEKAEAQLLNAFANLEKIYEKFCIATGFDDGSFPDMAQEMMTLNKIIECYKMFNNIATNLEVVLLQVDLEIANLTKGR